MRAGGADGGHQGGCRSGGSGREIEITRVARWLRGAVCALSGISWSPSRHGTPSEKLKRVGLISFRLDPPHRRAEDPNSSEVVAPTLVRAVPSQHRRAASGLTSTTSSVTGLDRVHRHERRRGGSGGARAVRGGDPVAGRRRGLGGGGSGRSSSRVPFSPTLPQCPRVVSRE